MDLQVEIAGKIETKLAIFAQEVEREQRDIVNDIASFALERFKTNVPLGATGNLRAAFQKGGLVTTARDEKSGRFIGGSNNVEIRIGLGDIPISEQERDPRSYALAINDGTKLIKRLPGFPLVMHETLHAGGSPGGNVWFSLTRAAQPGVKYFEKTREEVDVESRIRVAQFLRNSFSK